MAADAVWRLACGHPSRLAVKDGERLRMMAEFLVPFTNL
jgi:hypothetical protein